MNRICDHEGCDRGIHSGHALYRTSPKGTPFVGLCEVHYAGEPDPVARLIEQSNQRSGDGRAAHPREEAP
jgi:hypothetical protein